MIRSTLGIEIIPRISVLLIVNGIIRGLESGLRHIRMIEYRFQWQRTRRGRQADGLLVEIGRTCEFQVEIMANIYQLWLN